MNSEAQLCLRLLRALIEDNDIVGSVVDGFPGDGNIGSLSFLNGNRLNNGLRGFQHPVAGQNVLAPGQEVDGHCAGGIEVDGTFALYLGNHNLLHLGIGGRSHGTTLDGQAVVIVKGHHYGSARLVGICQQHVHRTGLVHLEGEITFGGNTLAGEDGSLGEVDTAIGIERSSLGTHQHEFVTHAGVLHITGEEAGVLEIPGMGFGNHVLREVFFFLRIRNPPFGSTHMTFDEILGGQLEEVALGVVAGIHVHGNETGGLGRYLREEILALGIAVVAGGGPEGRDHGIGIHLEELAAVSVFTGLAAVFPQEQVVLQGHLMRDAHGEDAAVVAIVDGGDVLHGVVLEVDVADLDGVGSIDAEEGANTVVQGIVHEDNLVNLGGLADIHRITAAAEDAVHVAGIEFERANLHHVVVVPIEETGHEVGDVAVHEGDAAHDRRTSGVFHDTGTGGAVKLDALEVENGILLREISRQLYLAGHDRLGTIGTQFALQREAGGRLGRTHGVTGLIVGQIVLTTANNGCLQLVGSGKNGGGTLLGHGENILGTAGGAHVEEGYLILGGSGEAFNSGLSGCTLGIRNGMLHGLAALHGNSLNLGHLVSVGDFRAPGKGHGCSRTGDDFREEVVLYGIRLHGAVIHSQMGFGTVQLETVGIHSVSRNGEPVFLVGRQTGGEGNLAGRQRPGILLRGKILVRVHGEQVLTGIFVHIPAEGDVVTGGGVHPGAQILRL